MVFFDTKQYMMNVYICMMYVVDIYDVCLCMNLASKVRSRRSYAVGYNILLSRDSRRYTRKKNNWHN